jgi:transcriptional regulator with XRE-family HTH domain
MSPPDEVRRTPGLRRQELAKLAGVSPDYITQLEQGRARTPSAQVLGSLARSLGLSEPEIAHLYRLAGKPAPVSASSSDTIPAEVRAVVEQFHLSPVAVYNHRWDQIAYNQMWARLLGDPRQRQPIDRNMVWGHFSGVESRVTRDDAERDAFERSIVADLRESLGYYPDDAKLIAMIDQLCARSARFHTLWNNQEVATYEDERKLIRHPEFGDLDLNCRVLRTRHQDFLVVSFTADLGSDSEQRLLQMLAEVRAEQHLTGTPVEQGTLQHI